MPSAIFSMIHGALSKPAPGVDADRLVVFETSHHDRPGDPGENSYLTYLVFAGKTRTMESIAATRFSRFNVGLPDATWQLRGFQASPNYFRTIGVHLAMGREFTEDEASGAAPLVAIIAWHVWQNQFHATPDAIGRSILINGLPATVVGVAPAGFHGLELAPHFEICVPLEGYARALGVERQLRDPAALGYTMVGRLVPGVSLERSQSEFNVLASLIAREFPKTNSGRGVILAPYPTVSFGPLGGPQSRLLRALLLAAGLLTLAIVCANVANLVLARGLARRREMAVRMALGASWARVLGVVAGEIAALCVVAGAAALLFTVWITRIIGALLPPIESGAHFDLDLSPDWTVALYAVLLAVLCTLLVAVAPAVRLWRQPMVGSALASQAPQPRLAQVLVVAQLALCVVLATGGAFAWSAISSIDTTNVVIARDHLLLAATSTSGSPGADTVLERIRDRLLALPGVTSVSWALAAPPDTHSWKHVQVTPNLTTQGMFVGPGYLSALGIRPVEGRDLSGRDDVTAAVINRKLAGLLWPGRSAIGRTFTLPSISNQPLEVVGVAPDAPYSGIADDGSYTGIGEAGRVPFVFLPDVAPFRGAGQKTFHIRYTGDRRSLATEVRAAIHDVDPQLPVFSIRSMEQEWSTFTGPLRLIARLVQSFAIVALLLSCIGLYAVVSFQTAARTHEFGIRTALGATPQQSVALALRGGLSVAAIGLAAGTALAIVVMRAVRSVLFGLAPADPLLLAGVLATLLAVSLIACYIPSSRAARIDPMAALRES
jgi:predicted permease